MAIEHNDPTQSDDDPPPPVTGAIAAAALAVDRRVVAFAHSRRNEAVDVITEIDPTTYEVVDVVVRKTLIDELGAHSPDVVVIDDSLADFDTTRLCQDIRNFVGSRVLVLAAAERIADESWTVGVIEAGADDVVPRSISASLLRTHLLALMRLAPERRRPASNVIVGDVDVNVDGYSVFIAGRLVRFPKLQFELLLALARRPNKVVSFDQLLAEVWGLEPSSMHPRRVRVAASLLRKLLGEGVRRPRLETVPRVGYRLVVPA